MAALLKKPFKLALVQLATGETSLLLPNGWLTLELVQARISQLISQEPVVVFSKPPKRELL